MSAPVDKILLTKAGVDGAHGTPGDVEPEH